MNTGYKHKRLQRPAFALYMLDIRPARYATEEVKQIFLARKFSWKKSIIEIRLMFCMIKNIELQIAKGKINNDITFFVIVENAARSFQ